MDKIQEAKDALRLGLPTIQGCDGDGYPTDESLVKWLADDDLHVEQNFALLLTLLRADATDELRADVRDRIGRVIGSKVEDWMAEVASDLAFEAERRAAA